MELDESDGEYYLMHEVKPGRHKNVTHERNSRFGWRLVPQKAFVMHIIIEVRYRATVSTRTPLIAIKLLWGDISIIRPTNLRTFSDLLI